MKNFNWDYYHTMLERALTAVVPEQTDTYSPVPHGMFLGTLKQKLISRGYEIYNHTMYCDLTGKKLTGYYTVTNANEAINDFGVLKSLGYKNSYDKSMPVGFAAGGHVIVCSNGMVKGDLVAFKRKHTGDIMQELSAHMDLAIEKMDEGFAELLNQADMMRNYSLTPRQKAEILGIMYFEKNLVTPEQVSVIRNQIKNSDAFRDSTLWDLYNNTTEALKSTHPLNHIRNHSRLHDFMLEIAGDVQPVEIEPLVEEAVEAHAMVV